MQMVIGMHCTQSLQGEVEETRELLMSLQSTHSMCTRTVALLSNMARVPAQPRDNQFHNSTSWNEVVPVIKQNNQYTSKCALLLFPVPVGKPHAYVLRPKHGNMCNSS